MDALKAMNDKELDCRNKVNELLQCITSVGLVAAIFHESKLYQPPGSSTISRVKYSTTSSFTFKNMQLFAADYRLESVGVSHNRNLVNYQTRRDRLEERVHTEENLVMSSLHNDRFNKWQTSFHRRIWTELPTWPKTSGGALEIFKYVSRTGSCAEGCATIEAY
ncbi:hypothetical protein SUGI_1288770 [Cryptomeria japonica]|uniref:Uncharacterized protein n=1 Tax=Cryptomeria japonica TaxID=3369 RepID=A0AAD3NQ60_CRYJA|nr:hypothetical protein SUGI_1288710 [Cryptomeria japonica]GLJ57044.1 hypothetical protein SUGI_1288740 [Cryptomeria japonica]GLJ57046.1 hypothetical protein SUGI_1288770 [Cryptomeria japonica]